MANLKELLTRKVGPLPVWAWGGLGVAGIAAYRYRHAASTPSDQATSFDQTAMPPDLSSADLAAASGDGMSGFLPVSPVYGSTASGSYYGDGGLPSVDYGSASLPPDQMPVDQIPPSGGSPTTHHRPAPAHAFQRGVITGRIRQLQRGGVTPAERRQIRRLRRRRRRLRGR